MTTCPRCNGTGHAPERKPLTERQFQVYSTIQSYQKRMGVVPTFSTLAELIGVTSLCTVSGILDQIQRKGWLSKGRRGERQSMILLGDE